MTVFEYVTALLAIVLGLSIARVMSGIGGFIVAERRELRDWLIVGWCLALTLTQIGWWMLMWVVLGQAETITLATILYWVVATAMLFLASYILVPGVSLSPSTATMGILRSSFFVCLAIHFSIPLLDAVASGNLAPPLLLLLLVAVLSATGAFLTSDKAHFSLLIVWTTAMLTLTILAVPSVGGDAPTIFSEYNMLDQ
jgi:hypothetical protein